MSSGGNGSGNQGFNLSQMMSDLSDNLRQLNGGDEGPNSFARNMGNWGMNMGHWAQNFAQNAQQNQPQAGQGTTGSGNGRDQHGRHTSADHGPNHENLFQRVFDGGRGSQGPQATPTRPPHPQPHHHSHSTNPKRSEPNQDKQTAHLTELERAYLQAEDLKRMNQHKKAAEIYVKLSV